MNNLSYCLDTHPLIWYFTANKTLSTKIKKILDEIFTGKLICFIPTIVLLEIFHISLKRKEFVFRSFLNQLQRTNIIFIPLEKIVLEICFKLSPHLDIHDRIIVATAIVNQSVLISKDKEIKKFTKVKIVW